MPFRFGGVSRGGGGGAVTEEVYIPAVALFEHPEDATTLFEAVDGGAAGLTVTLREPLEYGQQTSDWSIVGAQRYQGVAEIPPQTPSITGASFTHTRYLGEFTTANAPARDALTELHIFYDTTLNLFQVGDQNNDWANVGLTEWRSIFGNNPTHRPWDPEFGWASSLGTAGYYEYTDQDAVELSLGENYGQWTGGTYNSSPNVLWFDQSDGDVKTFGAVTPAIPAVAATLDLPTSGTGGIRVTYDPAGAGGNSLSLRASPGNGNTVVFSNSLFLLVLNVDATAANALAALNAHANLSAAYYGTETGTTVVRSGNGPVLTGWGSAIQFSGGVNAIPFVDTTPAVPADPVHVVVDRENTRITAYYNRAAGGALTDADTLGDLKSAFDTAAEGLSSEYVGGADANTDVTRAFANVSQFSQADLRGLRLFLSDPVAAGAAGNAFGLVARERFAGGAEQTERQAHILIYTNTGRSGGIRVTLDADIQGLNEHGVPVDVSSGALGNEWHFVTRAGTDNSERVIVSAANRQIIFESNRLGLDDTFASQVLDACNQGGTGCSATTFGGYGGSHHVFRGSLGDLNASINQFHGGRDYHAATANPEPITITQGPTHAHTRLYTTANGGLILSLIDPAHDAGNGYTFETVEGPNLGFEVVPTEERVTLTIPAAGVTAAAIFAAANAHEALAAVYFGTEDGATNVLPTRFGRHEFLGGLDSTEIEIQYAPEAKGGIATPDTMGDVKTAWDAAEGRTSFYYGGADAATTASRLTPWEHEFEDGETIEVNLSGFGLGPEQNEFTGADRAAAEAARDTYAAANPAWVEAYRGAMRVWIALRWGTNQVGQVLRPNASNPPAAGDWIDQNLALRGERGRQGIQGDDANVKDFARVGGRLVAPGDAEGEFLQDSEVKDYAKTGGGQVPDSDIPAAIMRDVEFTAAAVRNLIGLTEQQLNDVLTGGSILNRVLTFTQADGTDVQITLPPDADTQDGVVASGAVNPGGTELTLTLSTGATVVIDLPAVLRASGVTEARVNDLITAGVKEFARAGGRGVRVGDIDSDGAADDTVITADGADGAAWEAQQGSPPVDTDDHIRYFGWSVDRVIETADFAAANQSMTNSGTLPVHGDNDYVWFAIPASEGDPSALYLGGIQRDQLSTFEKLTDTVDDEMGTAHTIWVSNNELLAVAYSGADIELIY